MSERKAIVVIKIGGNDIEDAAFLSGLTEALSKVQESALPVIVHGGGKEIADLHRRLQVPFEMVDGIRVTSAESLRLVEMTLNGLINTRVVRWLVNRGIEALGLSGVDFGLVQAVRWQPGGADFGFVGRVTAVRAAPLLRLLDQGFTPVVAPVSLGEDGQTYNVNADHVASALAHALQAQRLVFVTNVPGVLVAGRVVRALTVEQVEEMIQDGIISGGMIPKVRSAVAAVNAGVYQAVISDLDGLARGGGTAILPAETTPPAHRRPQTA